MYADLAALVTKYTQPESIRKRNSCITVVALLLPPHVLDATGVDASLMLEITAVIAVVTERLIIPECKVNRVRDVNRTLIVNCFSLWGGHCC